MGKKYIPVDEFVEKLDILITSAANASLREALKEWGKTIAVEAISIDEHEKAQRAQKETISRLYDMLDETCKNIRECTGKDYVCGLCQYDADHGEYGDANECPGFETDECFCMKNEIRKLCGVELIREPCDDFVYDPAIWEDTP